MRHHSRMPCPAPGLVLLTCWAASVGAQDITVTRSGMTQLVPAAVLESLARDTAWVRPRNQPSEAHLGVALDRLLAHVGVSATALRHGAGTHFVFIESRDGYRVVLSYGELDPRAAGHHVLLERGGGDQAGTWRLIVPSEVRGPRWARDVVRIDVKALAGGPAGDRLVVLVRHAEKADEPGGDPPLSDAGQERVAALADVLASTDIDAVIVTPFERTRATAAPLARARGITPVEVPVGPNLTAHVAAVADAVRTLPAGDAVLVVGHSNTIPAIVTALGGPALADLCDSQYAVLYVLSVPAAGPTRLVTASYGAADPPGTGCPTMR